VVDDFGRQRVAARDLLNRWIVPLESRVDYLNLLTGRKFQVPFDVMVVFATNLDPRSLADEAFLRRIPYKIFAKNPTLPQFERIFEMNCRRHGIPFDPAIVKYLCANYYTARNLQMRACHPRDLTDHVVSLCRYHQRKPEMTTEMLDAVCQTYFLEDSQGGEVAAR
jgi:SpoVK/Ycf46/Vps4 family AAA+-type ATPase